jgi:hypothetical protein
LVEIERGCDAYEVVDWNAAGDRVGPALKYEDLGCDAGCFLYFEVEAISLGAAVDICPILLHP